MKYLLVFALVLVAIWFWRQGRKTDDDKPLSAPRPAEPLPPPTAMVACLHCGTHLPEAEAVRGQQGAYCCEEHQRLSEGQAS